MKLYSLHECLQDAALLEICKTAKDSKIIKETVTELMRLSTADYDESVKKGLYNERIHCSFCIDKKTLKIIHRICIQNGATMSSFLRACCYRLIEEYNYGARQKG